MMYIKNLDWISKSAEEAELVVTDDTYICIVFSQPCKYQEGDKLLEPLHAFMAENLMISYELNFKLERISNFEHRCVARVTDIDENLVRIGDISVKLDVNIPSWAENGSLIEFECCRIDLW